MLILHILYFSTLFLLATSNKYSKEYNLPTNDEDIFDLKDLKNLDKPFRMQKINLIWEKAQKRLGENRLKFLYSELKIQDKDELAFKKLKSANLDKGGQKEAEVVRSLNKIIHKFNLENRPQTEQDNEAVKDTLYFDPLDKHLNKRMFKDKKLNKLWLKAEQLGLSSDRLKALKEEFQHHQDKIDQLYDLMDTVNLVNKEGNREEVANLLNAVEEEEVQKDKKVDPSPNQLLKDKHVEIRKGYDSLANQVLDDNYEFDEPEVETLWVLAKKANFSNSELESLRDELIHYEQKIKKLNILRHDLQVGSPSNDQVHDEKNKEFNEKRYKQYHHKVKKLHKDFEHRIYTRHSEL